MLACLAVPRWALEACRSGNGPVLIEAFTYRMDAHTTSDDPSRYRLADELELWKLKDPIERVKAYLVKNEMADSTFFDEIDAEAKQVGADLRKQCLALPDPAPLSIFDHVYAEPHPLMTEEQEQFAAYLAGFADADEEDAS